jgi:endonuclease YncB( thermonuclease family)
MKRWRTRTTNSRTSLSRKSRRLRRIAWKIDGIDVRLPLAIIVPLGLLVGAGLARGDLHPLPRLRDVPSIVIASTIDGDTIEIHGQRIRLDGIDAPESRQTCRRGDQIERFGQASGWYLAELSGSVPVACVGQEHDRYGRLLGICHRGELDLNGAMVEAGQAGSPTSGTRCATCPRRSWPELQAAASGERTRESGGLAPQPLSPPTPFSGLLKK